MSRIDESCWMKRIHLALKAFTVAALAAATFFVFSANPVVAFNSGGCSEELCRETFGDCVECAPPWDPYVGVFTRCVGNVCYYPCGGDECPEDDDPPPGG